MIGSPRAYLSRNRRAITWVSKTYLEGTTHEQRIITCRARGGLSANEKEGENASNDNDTCPLCNTEKQFTKFTCVTAVPKPPCPGFGSSIGGVKDFKQNLTRNERPIVYGWHQKSRNERVLLAKYHIFCTSVRNKKLDFDSFLLRLRTKLNLFREVSLEEKTFNDFQSTWALLS